MDRNEARGTETDGDRPNAESRESEKVMSDLRKTESGCGERNGWRRHYREGTPLCDACRVIRREQAQAERRKRGIRPIAIVRAERRPKCGTASGYQRHRRLGEDACRACLRAWSEQTKKSQAKSRRGDTRDI